MDDEGRPHAGVNLFAFHDLAKRMAVMEHQMGLRPLVYLHMTNGNIVPMFSFSTMILDHEWRDSGENKDRLSRTAEHDEDTSLLLAQSTGLQSGCLSVITDRFFSDDRLSRSAMAVALTHEMKLPLYGAVHGVWSPAAANAAGRACGRVFEQFWLRPARLPRLAILGRFATDQDNRAAVKTLCWPAAARRWSSSPVMARRATYARPRSEGPRDWPTILRP